FNLSRLARASASLPSAAWTAACSSAQAFSSCANAGVAASVSAAATAPASARSFFMGIPLLGERSQRIDPQVIGDDLGEVRRTLDAVRVLAAGVRVAAGLPVPAGAALGDRQR